jgi:hypothetical protein
MDSWTLTQLAYAINDFTNWTQMTGGGFDQWASRLNSDDSSFKGKAAFLIYWRLKVEGDGLKDTYEQLASRHGGPISTSVADAAQQLQVFNTTMSRSWQIANGYNMRTWISDQVHVLSERINGYLKMTGLYKDTPEYLLDKIVDESDLATAKAYVTRVLTGSGFGDLTSADTWKNMSDRITQNALNNLKGFLDGPAQTAIGALAPKYVLAQSSLMELTDPPPETAPKPDTDTGDGGGGDDKDNLPPPPDGGGGGDNKINLPPPPDGGGGGGNLPPPPDGGGGGGNDNLDLPPADGGGGSDGLNLPDSGGGGGADGLNPPDGGGGLDGLNPPDGGGGPDELNGGGVPNGLDLANGGGPDGLNPPGGGDPADGGGGGGFLPGLVPPGGGANGDGGINDPNGTGPGSDGAFDENGLDNLDNLLGPPADGGGGGNGLSLLPSGSGDSKTLIPPGANGGGPNGNVDLGKLPTGVAGDGGLGSGGFGSDPGKGFGSGANLLGNGGAGNPFGGPGGSGGLDGNNGLGGASNLLNSGSPGADGPPGSPTDGSGGVPFFPPMMGGGGAGGAGEKPQERERQTWLTEDEEIWGTRVDVRSGAIGRLDEEEDEIEELPMVGPARRQRRADTPRRPRPDEKPDTERTTPAGEEVTGSA